MKCDKCGASNFQQNSFCVSCGSPITTPPPTPEPYPKPPVVSEPYTSDPSDEQRPKSRRPLAIVLISILAIGLGFGGTEVYEQWNEARLERLAQETLVEAFGSDVLKRSVTSCSRIADVVENIPEQQIAAYAESLEGITDPRQALAISQGGDFPSRPYTPGYRESVETEVMRGLTTLFRESERDDIAPAAQIVRWESEWTDFALSYCGARDQYQSNIQILVAADRSIDRIATMAANAPWYPEGFSEYSANLAYRWSTNEGGWPCNNCSFWKMTVLTKTGCTSGLYGEINILRGNSVVDWTNDLIAYLGPGETAVLTYKRYPYSSTLTGQLVQLSCY
jgi:hypothetical protein